MIQCFDILTGCNSALIRIRLHPDPDPVKIRILKYGIRCTPTVLSVRRLVCLSVSVPSVTTVMTLNSAQRAQLTCCRPFLSVVTLGFVGNNWTSCSYSLGTGQCR